MDESAVLDVLENLDDGEIIVDGAARTIASWYAGGQAVALSALSTSGAILPGAADAVQREMDTEGPAEDLEALLAYVQHHGVREPVTGWSGLWVR